MAILDKVLLFHVTVVAQLSPTLAARAKKRAKIFRFRATKARVREKSLSIFLLFFNC